MFKIDVRNEVTELPNNTMIWQHHKSVYTNKIYTLPSGRQLRTVSVPSRPASISRVSGALELRHWQYLTPGMYMDFASHWGYTGMICILFGFLTTKSQPRRYCTWMIRYDKRPIQCVTTRTRRLATTLWDMNMMTGDYTMGYEHDEGLGHLYVH